LLIEDELRERGRGEVIKPRTEEEYHANLAHQLRPQDELFATYLDEETTTTKTKESGGCMTMLYMLVGVCVMLGFLHRCTGILKPSPRVGFNVPNINFTPTIRYTPPNLNLSVPPMPPIPPSLSSSKDDPLAVHLLSVRELRRKMKNGRVVVVDVRSREEYLAGHIDGALSLPLEEIEERAADLPRSRLQLVAYSDEKRPRSYLAALRFQRLGHKNVAILTGGYEAWLDGATTTTPSPSPSSAATTTTQRR
jgi:rhodanese-related sulfurtransferase